MAAGRTDGRPIPGQGDPDRSPNPEGPHDRDPPADDPDPADENPNRIPDPENPKEEKRPVYLPPSPD